MLVVADPQKPQAAVESGIGTAKGMGIGLLSLVLLNHQSQIGNGKIALGTSPRAKSCTS